MAFHFTSQNRKQDENHWLKLQPMKELIDSLNKQLLSSVSNVQSSRQIPTIEDPDEEDAEEDALFALEELTVQWVQ